MRRRLRCVMFGPLADPIVACYIMFMRKINAILMDDFDYSGGRIIAGQLEKFNCDLSCRNLMGIDFYAHVLVKTYL